MLDTVESEKSEQVCLLVGQTDSLKCDVEGVGQNFGQLVEQNGNDLVNGHVAVKSVELDVGQNGVQDVSQSVEQTFERRNNNDVTMTTSTTLNAGRQMPNIMDVVISVKNAHKRYGKVINMFDSGWGSVGRVVASNTRGLWFKSCTRQICI